MTAASRSRMNDSVCSSRFLLKCRLMLRTIRDSVFEGRAVGRAICGDTFNASVAGVAAATPH